MNVPSLLKKELLWSRHRILALLLLLVLLPGFFAYTTVVFQSVIPEDAPVGIVAEDERVTEDDIAFIEGGAALFSEPRVYENSEAATRALQRESVYAVLEVPPGIFDESTRDATFTLYISGSIVPFEEPSRAIESILEIYLDRELAADVSVERSVVGPDHTLPEYLLPVFLMGIVMLFAFTYLPYNLAREADVLDRLRVESSLEAVVGTKIGYFALLMLVPIVAFHGAAAYLGYAVDLLSPVALFVYLLTFVYLSAISTTVMVLTDFDTVGRFLNVALLFGALTFSSLVYPVGFFSPLRREIARGIPLHYSMIVTRSATLKDVEAGLYTDWLAGLVAFAAVTGLVLKLAIVRYERRE